MNERLLRTLASDAIYNFGAWIEITGEVMGAQVRLLFSAIKPPRPRRKTAVEIAEQQESSWYKRVYGDQSS